MSTYIVSVSEGGVPVSVMIGRAGAVETNDLPVYIAIAGVDLPVSGGLVEIKASDAERLVSRFGRVSRAAWRQGGRPWVSLQRHRSDLHDYSGRVP
jgi:hypothetical protein